MSSIVVIFGRDRGHVFTLPRKKELVVGRSSALPHHLNDPSISREHLGFVYNEQDNTCQIIDKGSRNGARINQQRLLHSQLLEDGDVIQIGYTLMVYVRITFDAHTSVKDFLNDCEKRYSGYLQRLRDHAAMHTDKDDWRSPESSGSMSGTLHLGKRFWH